MKTLAVITLTLLLAACGASSSSSGAGPAPAASAPTGTAAAGTAAGVAAVDQPDEAVPPMSASQLVGDKLKTILAGNWRTAAEKARDRYRHPAKTLQFFGVEPDMTVIEVEPGGGWYAAILAPLLRDNGQYIAAVPSPLSSKEAARSEAALKKRFAAHPKVFGQADVIEYDPKTPNLGAPGSADMVLTFRNVHNWTDDGTAAAMFRAFYSVLRPGGVLGVVDHRADAGATLAQVKGSGYLPQAAVVKLAEQAGFQLAASSDVNANPKDDHHHPKGVWTLPPTLALGDTDKAKYEAIGESDRMTLRFVKPKAPAAAGSTPAPTGSSGS